MKFDYGKYTYKEVKEVTEKFFSEIDNIINTEHQSLIFMNTLLEIIEGLAPEVKEEMQKSSVLDWGCATGISLLKLKKFCGHDNIIGIDFSKNAIEYGKKHYNLNITDKELDKNYDIIITSNCLEHFKNFKEVMEYHASYCNKYYIVLVPLNGDVKENVADHITSFTIDNIPKSLNNFTLRYKFSIDFQKTGAWNGWQALLIYKRTDGE